MKDDLDENIDLGESDGESIAPGSHDQLVEIFENLKINQQFEQAAPTPPSEPMVWKALDHLHLLALFCRIRTRASIFAFMENDVLVPILDGLRYWPRICHHSNLFRRGCTLKLSRGFGHNVASLHRVWNYIRIPYRCCVAKRRSRLSSLIPYCRLRHAACNPLQLEVEAHDRQSYGGPYFPHVIYIHTTRTPTLAHRERPQIEIQRKTSQNSKAILQERFRRPDETPTYEVASC